MLIETFDLEEDPARRFVRYAMRGIVAMDPDSGATLRAGQGRRKLGSKRRYFLWGPASLLPAGLFDQTQLGTVTGYHAREALEAANKRLPKLLERLHFRQELVDRIRREELGVLHHCMACDLPFTANLDSCLCDACVEEAYKYRDDGDDWELTNLKAYP
jgi:hypothetical protein